MELVEFLMVMVSIIIGLGVAEVLTGVARELRFRNSVRHDWLHAVLVTGIFLALLQQRWECWSLQRLSEWSFPGLLMVLIGPVGLFLVVHLLVPGQTDLKET